MKISFGNWLPAFVTALALVSVANAADANYGGMIYQQCGNTWYQPQGSQYIVVNSLN